MHNRGIPLWRNRDFLLGWIGQTVSMLSSRISYIALMWWVLEKTDSPAAVAGLGSAAAIPSLLLGPIAGACIDRFDRRRAMTAVDGINALGVGIGGVLLFVGMLRVWQVYVLTSLAAAALAFHRPALHASIPNLAPTDRLTRANSWHQVSRSVSGLIVLALGGVLVGWIGPAPTLWDDAATFLLAGGSLLLTRFASPRGESGRGWRTILCDMIAGFRFLARRPNAAVPSVPVLPRQLPPGADQRVVPHHVPGHPTGRPGGVRAAECFGGGGVGCSPRPSNGSGDMDWASCTD